MVGREGGRVRLGLGLRLRVRASEGPVESSGTADRGQGRPPGASGCWGGERSLTEELWVDRRLLEAAADDEDLSRLVACQREQ